MMKSLKETLRELDLAQGWRALFVVPRESVKIDSVVETLRTLPWAKNAVPRPGCVMRVFESDRGFALVTGGLLTDVEGAHLFDMHERLKAVAACVYIVPAPYSAPAQIVKMYDAGVAPRLPLAEVLPNPRIWSVLSLVCTLFLLVPLGIIIVVALDLTFGWTYLQMKSGYFAGQASRTPLPAYLFLALSASGAVACGLMRHRRRRQLTEILSDPIRVVGSDWTPKLPPFPERR